MAIEKLDDQHFLIRELVASYVDDWKQKQGQRDHQPRHHFYFSDVSKCDRALFYEFKAPDKKRPITAKTLMMFAAGNMLHDDIQLRARQRGIVESARDLEYGLADWGTKATGRLDFIVSSYRFAEAQVDRGIAVAEIKTKNAYNFGEEEPSQEEIDQLLWYIDRLKESPSQAIQNSVVLDYGFIVYADRSMTADPLPLAAWRVDFDATRVAVIKARFSELDRAIQADAVPRRPYERDSIKCQYCRFRDYCWEGVPEATPPPILPDETVEKPEMELVESMAANYVRLKGEAKQIEHKLEAAHKTLLAYFRATGTTEFPVNGEMIQRVQSPHIDLGSVYLLSKLGAELFISISKPQAKLVQARIKAGEIDPEVYERAKQVTYGDTLRIKKGKGENHADQKSE